MKTSLKSESRTPGRMLLFVLLFGSLPMLMGGAAVAPALPLISEAFPDAPESMITLIISLPALAIAFFGVPLGFLADKIGKIKVFLFSCIIFTVAGISGFFLNSIELILVGRFLLGIGIAGISLCITSLITDYYDGSTRVKIISLQSAAMGFGILIMEGIGGSLALHGWREPFLIYLIGLILFFGVLFFLWEPIVKKVSSTNVENISNNKNIKTQTIFCYVTIFFVMISMYILPTKLPYYVAELGGSALDAGLYLGLHGVFETIACLSFRRLSTRLSRIQMLMIGIGLLGCGYVLLVIPSLPVIFVGGLIAGVGIGMTTPTLINWLSNLAREGSSGKIMGGYFMALNLGIFTSTFVVALLLSFLGTCSNLFLVSGIITLVLCVLITIVGHIISKDSSSKAVAQ